VLALRFAVERETAASLRYYGLALAASGALGFAANVAPTNWTITHCDAIASNSLAGGVFAGLALALAAKLQPLRPMMRGLAVAVSGTLALAVALALDPRCLHGPFVRVDPAIWPMWLDDVREMRPLLPLFRVNPLTVAAIAAFPAAALLATGALLAQADLRREFGLWAAAAAFITAAFTTVAAIRGFSYAIWLGMPLVAALAPRLFALLRLRVLSARVVASLMLTPMALSSGAITIADANGLRDTDSFARPESRHCIASASYAPLTRLPPGLVVTDVSHGPYLLALTPHSVMSAPYHRLGHGIGIAHKALASPPDMARRLLAEAKVDYVMICGPRPPDGLPEPARSRSLWGALQTGAVPGWLEPVPGMQPFAVYRVRS
jgi:hypothetical protein